MPGRAIDSKEALQLGIANRVVKCGSGLGQAYQYAKQIQKFPQQCVRVDRMSAYYATFEATSQQDALDYELKHGVKVIFQESVEGETGFQISIFL